MTPEEKQQLDDLIQWKKNMSASYSIPLENDQALRHRLASTLTTLKTSTKGVDSEDVSINEAGSSTKIALDDPDIFLQVEIGGITYYLPAYTS